MADRTCETCHRYRPPGTLMPDGIRPVAALCTSPRVVGNRPWGYVAVGIARAWDSPCGPDAKGWKAKE